MSEISRQSLFGKLNNLGFKALESAFLFAEMRRNPYLELAHWLHQILEQQNTDVHLAISAFDIDLGRLSTELTSSLDELPRGSTSMTNYSQHFEEAIEKGWKWATLKFGESQVRSGHVLVAALKEHELRGALLASMPELRKIKVEQLIDEFHSITSGSSEQEMGAQDHSDLSAAGDAESKSSLASSEVRSRNDALDRFTVNLTERAKRGDIDPVVGRDQEIRQMVDILMRRRQNNPILTGEAGVGKTAVVEGFARRLASGDIPPMLKDVELLSLDIGLLQAGASMKGEFEQRLRNVIDEVHRSTRPIVLFIDEVHTLVGAGGAAGTGDAANLMKPALARGTLRTIGATTWAEYKKYIEKDPALTRRFQVVKIEEPDEEKAIQMMRGVVSSMESHHKVQILDEALEASVKLSNRYIPDRQLPDKSVSLLDTAAARVAVSHHATPPLVEDCRRRIEALNTEIEILAREEGIGIDVAERRLSVEEALQKEHLLLESLQQDWTDQKGVVDEILEIRRKLRASSSNGDDSSSGKEDPLPEMSGDEQEAAKQRLSELKDKLTALQGDDPLILPNVDEAAVASVVADWTGIPLGRMIKDEIAAVVNLATTLGQRVIGQDHALEAIAKRVQTARAGLENPNKPVGVFMLAGPSGVGKTETALALAESLYGGEQNLITINMSEFQEAHTVSTLKGAPPGYVGYGEGGVLTEAVRRRPYSVVLLDEVEKAHPDVHEIFFQVFDKGVMEDGEGREVDFKNTLIILTTNVGTDLIMGMCADPDLMPEPDGIAQALRKPLLETFPPALLGRMVTIPYYPLSDDVLSQIVRLQLDRIVRRIRDNHRTTMEYSDDVVSLIVSRCTEPDSGGRMIDAILTNSLLPRLSRYFLDGIATGKRPIGVEVSVDDLDFRIDVTS